MPEARNKPEDPNQDVKPPRNSVPPTLATNLQRLRTAAGLSLPDLGRVTGISHSMLWKVEKQQLSLTFDKLAQLAVGLGVGVEELFGQNVVTASSSRRSLTRAGAGPTHDTARASYEYPCTDLLHRRMTPMVTKPLATSLKEFGEWSRHDGEEYVYVIGGPVRFETELYQPITLETGDSLYYDSAMGHAFLRMQDKEATILSVCSGRVLETEGGIPTVIPAAR
jgi:transcriptional regulator with XRE-family HTH domain